MCGAHVGGLEDSGCCGGAGVSGGNRGGDCLQLGFGFPFSKNVKLNASASRSPRHHMHCAV